MWMDNPENPTVIVIINEEDHIRFTGFHRDMQEVYDKVSKIYNTLDKELPFAKHEKYGNLGSCPSNI
jgi:protein arginine kinase